MLLIGALGSAACFFPATWFVKDSVWQLGVAIAMMLVVIGATTLIVPAVYPELFPASVRTIGIAIPYAVSVAAFGGTAAYLQAGMALRFGDAGHIYFGIYTIVLLLVGASTVLTLRETLGIEL